MKRPVITAHHPVTGQMLADVEGFTHAQIVFNEWEPAAMDFGLPKTSPHLHHSVWRPDGQRALYRVDARDLGTDADGYPVGVPEVWAGYADVPQGSPSEGTWTISGVGPSVWLEWFTVPNGELTNLPLAALAKKLIDLYPGMRLELGGVQHHGRGIPTALGGESAWGLLTKVARDRGERLRLVSHPSRPAWLLNCYHPMDVRARPDIEFVADLDETNNVSWSPAYQAFGTPTEIVGAAWSYLSGTGLESFAVKAPAGPLVGRKAALQAVLGSPLAQALAGKGPATFSPDIRSRVAMEISLAAKLRDVLSGTQMAEVTATKVDARLFTLMPGDVVSTRFASDPTGLFTQGQALITSATYQVWPSLSAQWSVELWATEG